MPLLFSHSLSPSARLWSPAAVWASKALKRFAISPSSPQLPSSSSDGKVQRLTVGIRRLLFYHSHSSAPAFALSNVSPQNCFLCVEMVDPQTHTTSDQWYHFVLPDREVLCCGGLSNVLVFCLGWLLPPLYIVCSIPYDCWYTSIIRHVHE